MFFSKIYGSWREIQFEKFEAIFEEISESNLDLGRLILDLGAANGYLKEFVSEKRLDLEIVALDVDAESLKRNPSEHRVLADGGKLPFKSGVFDSLFCVDVAHLLESLKLECVKAGGVVVLALPSRHEKRFDEMLNALDDCRVVRDFEVDGREKELVAILKKLRRE